ncbi:hypothetical protein GDO86_012131 [Hymenochirus boettgeri]|uniref:Proline and serine-rich protein 3 n=1 Tax=Hymenochirus boettgeri TaxID=247094 RepID=A0A8T2IRK1_9PIPI|nr:hypothetical protein GDO86_012131 [Hymenochirus boettgeri]
MAASSSAAIFSNLGSPFSSPVKKQTHYRPSQTQALTEDQKQTGLSPTRLLQPHLSDTISPPDLSFLGGIQRLLSGAHESDSSGPFDESWPSTEGSSTKTPERAEKQSFPASSINRSKEVLHSTDASAQDSVIARYLERFRYGRPTSRGERSPPSTGTKDFWWLRSSPDSPDVVRNQSETGLPASSRFSMQNLEMSPPQKDVSPGDCKIYSDHVDILTLQEKARKLVLRSESSLSSEGPVSSDGVGSSTSSNVSNAESDQSKVTEPVYNSPAERTLSVLAPLSAGRIPLPGPTFTGRIPSPNPTYAGTLPTLAPEEDVLYQWRLRRKMEQAREGTLVPTSRTRTPSPPVRIPKQLASTVNSAPSNSCGETKAPSDPHVPGSAVQLAPYVTSFHGCVPIASPNLTTQPCAVSPHMHLLCDIMPCVRSHPLCPRIAHPQERDPVHPGPTKPQTPECRDPMIDHQKTSPAMETQKGNCTKSLERVTKLTAQHVDKRAKSRKEKQKRLECKVSQSEKPLPKRAEQVPPESPVHRALGEVISERLFSPFASPQHKHGPKKQKCAPPPSQPSNQPHPLEIATQLLEEAEDSDGSEFTDDPLLQVLRDQREALRLRLR